MDERFRVEDAESSSLQQVSMQQQTRQAVKANHVGKIKL
jgi:hypothetical protein